MGGAARLFSRFRSYLPGRATRICRGQQTAAGVLRHVFTGRFLCAGADDCCAANFAGVALNQNRLGFELRVLCHCGREFSFARRTGVAFRRCRFFAKERCGRAPDIQRATFHDDLISLQ